MGGHQARLELSVLTCTELFDKQMWSPFDVNGSIRTNTVPPSLAAGRQAGRQASSSGGPGCFQERCLLLM